VAGAAAGTRVPLGAVAPFLAMPVILWLLTGLTRDEWIGCAAVVAGGSLVYMMTRTTHRQTA
jgi:hypothetical protein